MAKKIKIEQRCHLKAPHSHRMKDSEIMLIADRVEALIEERISKREKGEQIEVDDFEVVTEWL